MKRQLRKLTLLSKILPLDKFYVISVYDGKLSMQGEYDNELTKFLKRKKFKATIDDNGYLELSRSDIKIILT